MKTDITIHVEAEFPHLGIKIYPGSVAGADLPLPIYIAILSALKDVQERLNTTEQVVFVEPEPQEVQALPPSPEDAKQEPSVSPPHAENSSK